MVFAALHHNAAEKRKIAKTYQRTEKSLMTLIVNA